MRLKKFLTICLLPFSLCGLSGDVALTECVQLPQEDIPEFPHDGNQYFYRTSIYDKHLRPLFTLIEEMVRKHPELETEAISHILQALKQNQRILLAEPLVGALNDFCTWISNNDEEEIFLDKRMRHFMFLWKLFQDNKIIQFNTFLPLRAPREEDDVLPPSVSQEIKALVKDIIVNLPADIFSGSTTGGDVVGPASSKDNAVARYNGITGKIIQNSGVTISDTDEVAGATKLDVDNIRVDGNSITSTDTNGDINITPDGTGNVVLDGLSWPI
ncbi:MAG TPA: hypothetical protein QGF02_04800, partial [Candidatus Babeliales bacterium]|nr:hypothetical protein [Candidatus Babeliales bacterium]